MARDIEDFIEICFNNIAVNVTPKHCFMSSDLNLIYTFSSSSVGF